MRGLKLSGVANGAPAKRLPAGARLAAAVVAGALAASAGCGGGDAASPADFIGAWQGTSGSYTDICDGMTTMPTFMTFQLQIQSDGAGGVAITDGGCSIHYAVSGSSASLKGTQTCTSAGNTVTWTQDVFTLASDRKAMDETGNVSNTSSASSCTQSLSIHYVRAGSTTGTAGCAICDKAGACCAASSGGAAGCSIYSTAMCNAQPAAAQAMYAADICQTLLNTAASSGLAACQ